MEEGIMNHSEMIDSLIVDCNTAVRELVSGQSVVWCATMTQIVKKLNVLKTGIADDIKSKSETIEKLKTQLRNAGIEVIELLPDELEEKQPGKMVSFRDEEKNA